VLEAAVLSEVDGARVGAMDAAGVVVGEGTGVGMGVRTRIAGSRAGSGCAA
jgi:hypothetical protein